MKHGIENWTSISRFVGNGRTRSQCSQRWMRGLDPKISKTQWSQQEEELLIHLISVHGNKAWTTISSQMRNRSDVQCRYKYKQLLKEKRIRPGAIPALSPGTPHSTSPPSKHSPPPQQMAPIQTPLYVHPMPPIFMPQIQPLMMPMQQMYCMQPVPIQQASSPSGIPFVGTPIVGTPIVAAAPQPVPATITAIAQPQVPPQVPQPPPQQTQAQAPPPPPPNPLPPKQIEIQIKSPLQVGILSPTSSYQHKITHIPSHIEVINSPVQPSPIMADILYHKPDKENNPEDHVEVFHHAAPAIEAPAFNAKLYSVY